MGLDAQTTKAITLALFLVGTLILGFLPLWLGKHVNPNKSSHQIMISSLLCFGGGVLMATCLLHMLTEVRESLFVLNLAPNIPLAEIVLCIGFFLVYFIEESVLAFVKKKPNSAPEDIKRVRTFSVSSLTLPNLKKDIEEAAKRSHTTESQPETGLDHSDSHGSTSSLKDLLTVVALSFHAIFEGLAIGLEGEAAHVWELFAAVALHKYVIAFCVGLELFSDGKGKKLISIICMVIFASMSPVGIAIGIGLTSSLDPGGFEYQIMIGTLQGLAGGTLLYVAVFEILQREKSKESVNGVLQLFFTVLGFGLMTVSQIFLPEPAPE